MAQAFANFGSQVILVDRADRILSGSDADAATILARELTEVDGVRLCLGADGLKFASEIERTDSRKVVKATFERSGKVETITCDAVRRGPSAAAANSMCFRTEHHPTASCRQVLVATGRTPNVTGIGLDAAQIKHDERGGIYVDDTMATSNTDIYAIGDCASKWQFTHMAGATVHNKRAFRSMPLTH